MAPLLHANRNPGRDRHGTATLELAAAAPFLFLILLACIDFGRAISQSIELTHAVRAGAQYAVAAADSQALIQAAVEAALPPHLKSATTITAACYCGALPVGNTGLPPVAACDAVCPTGSARMMTLRAAHPFQPYTFAIGHTVATAAGFKQVVANVTIRHQ